MASIVENGSANLIFRIFQAIRDNNFNEIKRLISEQEVDVNLRDADGLTSLHVAAKANKYDSHYSIIELLLENGAVVNAMDKFGQTPLLLCVGAGESRIVQLLLRFNANIEIKDMYGRVPLMEVIFENLDGLEITKLLVENGANVSVANNRRQTPLHYLCTRWDKKCTVEAAKFLMKNGANIEALDWQQHTPLVYYLLYNICGPLFRFLCKYANFSSVVFDPISCYEMLSRHYSHTFWSMLFKHVAKLLALDLTMHPSFFHEVLKKHEHKENFNKYTEELNLAKSIKLKDSWVTYFNLLVDCKRKLKNYAGNKTLVEDFNNSDCLKKFPIYGKQMKKIMDKAVQRRRFFDDSTVNLSECWPILNPTHLIIKDILDCLTYKDYVVFVSKK